MHMLITCVYAHNSERLCCGTAVQHCCCDTFGIVRHSVDSKIKMERTGGISVYTEQMSRLVLEMERCTGEGRWSTARLLELQMHAEGGWQ